ncbi:MAG: FRG domain-containing protein [Planctomycetaceae bacterium]|nr:FRG domain-containing protein [Planctomycetaceae bacterium]
MARTPRWTQATTKDGVVTYTLSSWKYFADFIHKEMLEYREYIWRGQRCSDWLLESTLDRKIKKHSAARQSTLTANHLTAFRYAARGRRGGNPPNLGTENDWWALGQHHGLATPILDWSASPYVAAYFAFFGTGAPQTPRRTIFALNAGSTIESKNKEIQKGHTGDDRPPIVEFFRPLSDENARLVNQRGLFTRGPAGVDLEAWVKTNFAGEDRYMHLIKINIPNNDRMLCLRSLNRMNINHATLFPDLYGAGTFCNLDLDIAGY